MQLEQSQLHTRQTLLQRARKSSDQDAWNDFVRYYRKYIYVLIHKMQVKCDDIDDIAQSVLLKIWQELAKFEPDAARASFRTWLCRIIRNTVIDHLRRARVRNKHISEISETAKPLLPYAESELDAMIEREWKLHVATLAYNEISRKFSGNAIKVFDMSSNGVEPSVIAEELNISIDSVYTLKNRVKKFLTRQIRDFKFELEGGS